MRIDRRLLGWGVFFILMGAIPLAVRFGYLAEERVAGWFSLWPIILIGWGLALLLRRTPVEWVGGAISAVVFGLMAGGALATGFGGVSMFGGCGGSGQGASFATQSGTLATGGQMNVAFTCGTVSVGAIDGADWAVSGTAGGGRGPEIEASGTSVSLKTPSGTFFADEGQNSWTVGVPRTPSLGFGMTLNAGRGTADLTGANVASASLTVNAGSFRLDLGGAAALGDVSGTVNAGEATIILPAGDRSANLSLNAGSLEVCVPDDTPIRVTWSGALGSNDLDDAGLTEVEDDVWQTAGFAESEPHLELRVSANAGSFDLTMGGGCSA